MTFDGQYRVVNADDRSEILANYSGPDAPYKATAFARRGRVESHAGLRERKMKRYALFHFDQYYPGGGWNDFQGSFDTPEEAGAVRCTSDYRQIIDLQTGQDVA